MKVGIIGDTHGSKKSIRKIIAAFPEAELFLHTGDHWQDGVLIEQTTGTPVLTVRGNCDQYDPEGKTADELVFTLEEKSFFLTHGHNYGVKYGLARITAKAEELSVDFCIFGHTHRSTLEKQNGIWFLNPGSLTWPRGQKKYAGILLEDLNNISAPRYIDIDM